MQEGFSAESIGEYCCVGRLARDMRAGMARPLRIEYPGAVYHVIVVVTIVRTFSKTNATATAIWRSWSITAK